MLTLTRRARDAVRDFADPDSAETPALRITLQESSPLAPLYGLTLVGDGDRRDSEVEVGPEDLRIFIEQTSAGRLDGATVDFVDGHEGSGFEIRGLQPLGKPGPTGPIAERVRKILDEQVNPGIAAHGGEIKLISVHGTEISIEMSGGCQGCALSRMTLRQGVERMLLQSVPEITAIHDVTDHEGGENPYFERP